MFEAEVSFVRSFEDFDFYSRLCLNRSSLIKFLLTAHLSFTLSALFIWKIEFQYRTGRQRKRKTVHDIFFLHSNGFVAISVMELRGS